MPDLIADDFAVINAAMRDRAPKPLHCFTNISDLTRIPVYEEAARRSGAPITIGDASDLAPRNADWRGLWAPHGSDLSDFWEVVRAIDAGNGK